MSTAYTFPELLKAARASTGKSLSELSRLSEADLLKLVPDATSITGPRPVDASTPFNQLLWESVREDVGPQLTRDIEDKVLSAAKKISEDTTETIAAKVAAKKATEVAKITATQAAIEAINHRIPRETRVVLEFLDGTEIVSERPTHKQLVELLYWVAERENVYLWGHPGTGKTTAAFQVSEILSLQFGYISLNPQTPASALIGYKDINSNTVRTLFRECYEHGGVFLVDEIDNAADTLLTSLNGALDNGIAAFPDKVVPKHKDFVCIATGNTAARGGNIMHSGRRAFDSATVDRFVFINWTYDEDLEAILVRNVYDSEAAVQFMLWVREVRNFVEERQLRVLASPRSSFRGARALKHSTLGLDVIADRVLFKGVDEETRRQVLTNCPLPSIKK